MRHAGCYYCQVENQYGVEFSVTATVIVSTLPTANVPSGTSGFTYSQLSLKGSANTFSNNGSQMPGSRSISAELES